MSAAVERALAEQLGLLPRQGWEKELTRAVNNVAERHRLPSGSAPGIVVERSPLLHEVAEELAVSESYFFRGLIQLEQACEVLARRVETTGRATVWSAGCSRGEEPYSVLALLHDRLGAAKLDQVTVIATDLSSDCITQAELGVFSAWSLRAVEEGRRATYFTEAENRYFQLKQHLLGRVHFNRATIQTRVSQFADCSLDVVLFRNVGIYLTAETVTSFIRSVETKLVMGGLLLMAATDPLPNRHSHPGLAATGVGSYERTNPPERKSVLPWPLSVRPAPPDRSPNRSETSTTEEPISQISQALRLADTGQLQPALDQLHELAKHHPDDPRVLFARGQVLLADEQFTAAMGDFQKIGRGDSDYPLAQYYRTLCCCALGVPEECVRILRELELLLAALPERSPLAPGCTTEDLRQAIAADLRRLG